MRNTTTELIKILSPSNKVRKLVASFGAVLACLSTLAHDDGREHDYGDEETHYGQFNLVSDLFGVAQLQDTNVVNAWGISFGAGGPFWISDSGTGKATLYAVTNDATGAPHVTKNARVVTIPGFGVTANLNNTTTGFRTNVFLFASLGGTISGWRPALGNDAEVLASRITALYTGITLATNGTSVVLLAANFSEGTVDEYDSTMHLVGRFADRRAPAGYKPYNVQNVADTVFVTFAKLDATKPGVITGRGRGLIDTFTVSNGVFHRFATGQAVGGKVRQMDAPWGVALAPSSFGSHADQLLVGNFGSGTIMAFDANGKFRGLLKGAEECPVTIDGLWGLTFGGFGSSGVATDLYFTAGPNGETHGLFGVIQKENADDDNDDHGQAHGRY